MCNPAKTKNIILDSFAITLFFHYYGIAEPLKNANAPATISTTQELLELGLIEQSDFPSGYSATAKGIYYAEKLFATTLPEQVWR